MLTLDFTKRNGNELKYSWRQNSELFILRRLSFSLFSLSPYNKKPHPFGVRFYVYGALGWIRTTDRSVRSRVLYPAELRVHFFSHF